MTRKIRRTRNKSSRKSIRGKRTNRKVRVSHRKNTNRKNTNRKNTNRKNTNRKNTYRKTSRNYSRKMLQIGGAEGQEGDVNEVLAGESADRVLQEPESAEGESLSQLRGKKEQKQEKIEKQNEQIEKLNQESSNLNIINKLDILLDKMWASSCETDEDDSFKQIVDAIQTQIDKDDEELKILNEKIKNKDIELSEIIKHCIEIFKPMINDYNQNVEILRRKKNDINLDKLNLSKHKKYKDQIISLINRLKPLDLFKREDIEKYKTDGQTWEKYYRGELAEYDKYKGLIKQINELFSEFARLQWRFAITSTMASKRFHRNVVGDPEADPEGEPEAVREEDEEEEDEEEDEEEGDEEEGDEEEVDRNDLRQFIIDDDITPGQTEELKRQALEIINSNKKILLAYGFIDEYIFRFPNISEEDKDKIEGYKVDEDFQNALFIYWRKIKNIEDKKRKKIMLLKFVKGYPIIPPDPAQVQVEQAQPADPEPDPALVEGEQGLDSQNGGGEKSKVLTIDELEEFNRRIKTTGGDPNGEVERAINEIKEIRDLLGMY